MSTYRMVNKMPVLRSELPYRPDTTESYAHILQRPWSGLLDSVGPTHAGRFDILVTAPRQTLLSQSGHCFVDSQAIRTEAAASEVWSWLRQHAASPSEVLPDIPFGGGLLGYFAYDLKPVSGYGLQAASPAMPDMALGLYDGALLVDHQAARSWLVCQDHAEGRAWQAAMRAAIEPPLQCNEPAFRLLAPPACQLDFEAYLRAFARVADYIQAGDCYQVNLAMRFSAPCSGHPWPLYRRLRQENPAPYSAWLNYPFGQVLSSSPEQFLALRAGQVTSRPIKGTRPRSSDPQEDVRRSVELAESSKDRAENLMIVDLLRNDLGKVCSHGSICVPQLFQTERFASVHHLVSTVCGQLAPGKDAFDLLAASFPGGSITGAPKRRAMQIINELEAQPRGPYCGAIGYLGADGDMDFNIAIRTLVVKDGEVSFWVGSGLVADSDPQAEYQECLDKAQALLASLEAFL